MSRPAHPALPVVLLGLIFSVPGCGNGGSGGSGANRAAVAADDFVTTAEDLPIDIDVTANDSRVDPETLVISSPAVHGTTSLPGPGIVTYTPDDNYNGTDTFSYRVVSSVDSSSLSAVVTITVSDINDSPIAADDFASTFAGSPVEIDVVSNDLDVDGTLDTTSLQISDPAINGQTTISSGMITYTPDNLFAGTETLTYSLQDDRGDRSNLATVIINVLPVDTTVLTTSALLVPTSEYVSVYNEEFDEQVLTSPWQTFTLPEHTVSFGLFLEGPGIQALPNELTFSHLAAPGGQDLAPLFSTSAQCAAGFCSLLVPRKPGIPVDPGEWQFRLSSRANNANITSLPSLNLALRTGPRPDTGLPVVSILNVKPFLTGNTITPARMSAVIEKARELLLENGIRTRWEPLTHLDAPEFARVTSDFGNESTTDLISHGNPAMVNVFFVEDFVEPGLLGITGAVPPAHGIASRFNGALVNATLNLSADESHYVRATAEVSVHEIGHYLGLAHTTSNDFTSWDILEDTPECVRAEHDENEDGFADMGECPDGANLMFWQNLFEDSKTSFSAHQQEVMHFSPLAITNGELPQ